jgi:hypothetical protein
MAVLVRLCYWHVAPSRTARPAAAPPAAPAVMLILVSLVRPILGLGLHAGCRLCNVIDIDSVVGVEVRPFFSKHNIIGWAVFWHCHG